jgi:hypothetical protein
MKRIHLLLGVQSVLAILVSINRLGTWTLGYVLPNEFLRWVDLNNMIFIPLISLVATYLLKKTIEYNSPAREGRVHIAWNLVFIIGLYLTAASYGVIVTPTPVAIYVASLSSTMMSFHTGYSLQDLFLSILLFYSCKTCSLTTIPSKDQMWVCCC